MVAFAVVVNAGSTYSAAAEDIYVGGMYVVVVYGVGTYAVPAFAPVIYDERSDFVAIYLRNNSVLIFC